jgi:hypothetical protein
VISNPLARAKAKDQGPIQATGAAEVEVFDGCGQTEPGDLEQPSEAPILPEGDLPLQEEGESVLEGEVFQVGALHLLFECLGHPGQAQLVEAFESLLGQHERAPVSSLM